MTRKIVFSALFVFFLVFSSLHLTDFFKNGFRIQKILFPRDFYDPHFCFESKDFDLYQVLSKPFKYLGKGRQCFVFENEDYVLKFLRYDRIAKPFYLYFLPNYREKKISKTHTFSQWIKSYAIAFDHLPNETVLIYAKLNFEDVIPSKATLQDRLGNAIKVDLKNCLFFIQKKVTPLDELFSRLKKEQKLDKAFFILDSFFDVISSRMEKNIQNKTTSCFHNVGWLNDKVVEFDIGDLKINEGFQNKRIFQTHLISFVSPLRCWLLREVPELVEYFDQKLKTALEKTIEIDISDLPLKED